MADKTSLGDRMKRNYENISRTYLTRRTPVIVRLDGRAFHTFARGMKRPFDSIMVKTMKDTTRYLCENIQGCVFGYTQSDEISLLLVDYKTLNTSAWFDYNVQKMASVSASMATMAFNKFFMDNVYLEEGVEPNLDSCKEAMRLNLIRQSYFSSMKDKIGKAMFDSRVFNIPKEEVTNYFVWRQQDATRNSIQSVGQANFSDKEMDGKSCDEVQDMLFKQKGINWNDLETGLKRGTGCYKRPVESILFSGVSTKVWISDYTTPIFTQNREYIEQWVNPKTEE